MREDKEEVGYREEEGSDREEGRGRGQTEGSEIEMRRSPILCEGSGLAPSHECGLRLMPGSLVSHLLVECHLLYLSAYRPGPCFFALSLTESARPSTPSF